MSDPTQPTTPRAGRCPTCGVDPREIRDQLQTRAAARTQLIREATRLGLSSSETADLLAGVRTFPGVQLPTDQEDPS